MKTRHILYITGLFLSLFLPAQGQDLFFSQFYAAPLTLNPALTGLSTGDLRVNLNYRDQRQNLIPANTQAASADMKILKGALNNDVASVGMVYVQDDQAEGLLTGTLAMVSGAFHKAIGRNNNHFVALGIQGGIFQRKLDASVLTFNNQYNDINKFFDETIPHQVNIENEQSMVIDANAGLMWYHFISRRSSIFAGVSVFHINSPKESFLGKDVQIPRRYVFHGGRRIPLDEQFSLIPNVLFMHQNGINQITGGTSGEYVVPDSELAFKLGAWYRYNDNLIITSFGFEIMDFEIGVSYDLLSSVQNLSNTPGGLEFSLSYSPSLKKIVDLDPNPGTQY